MGVENDISLITNSGVLDESETVVDDEIVSFAAFMMYGMWRNVKRKKLRFILLRFRFFHI